MDAVGGSGGMMALIKRGGVPSADALKEMVQLAMINYARSEQTSLQLSQTSLQLDQRFQQMMQMAGALTQGVDHVKKEVKEVSLKVDEVDAKVEETKRAVQKGLAKNQAEMMSQMGKAKEDLTVRMDKIQVRRGP